MWNFLILVLNERINLENSEMFVFQVNGYNEYSKENNHQNNLNNNNMPNCQEYILDDDECPLAILMSHAHSQGKY